MLYRIAAYAVLICVLNVIVASDTDLVMFIDFNCLLLLHLRLPAEPVGSRQTTQPGAEGGILLPSLELNNNVVQRNFPQIQATPRVIRQRQKYSNIRPGGAGCDEEADGVKQLQTDRNESVKPLLVEPFEAEVIKVSPVTKTAGELTED